LTGDRDYIYARYKYAGPWNISYTNSLIKSFKAKERNQRFFKEKAARQFCVELRNLVPKGGYLTYVLPSTKKGDPGYDNRFELLAEYLQGEGRTSLWPLQVKASTEPAHEAAPDSDLRDPDNIMANLEWVQGIPAECEEIYIVDDVLTKGGHLRAYADFIQQAYPDLTIKCVAWALHTSTQWYEPQA
jgi:predicted amidophosphoribosyltransferase